MRKVKEIYYLEPEERCGNYSKGIKFVFEDGSTLEQNTTDCIADRFNPAEPTKDSSAKDEAGIKDDAMKERLKKYIVEWIVNNHMHHEGRPGSVSIYEPICDEGESPYVNSIELEKFILSL